MTVNIAKHDCTIIWNGVYYFSLSDYPNITLWELKKLLTFIDYEKRHGRDTDIICDDKNIIDVVDNAIAHPQTIENVLIPDKITECVYCKHKGCLTKFVCHTATIDNAKKILSSGKLLSAVKAFGKNADELVLDERNAAGDPADYFNYIMFGWGNCTAGDNLVMERLLGVNSTAAEREAAFIPGVRFYFRHEDIIRHPGYVFDGYHPAKIKDELLLSDYLHVCITSEKYKNDLVNVIKPEIASRILYTPQNSLGLLDWTEKVYESVEKWGLVKK
jgi:hypothetical protein